MSYLNSHQQAVVALKTIAHNLLTYKLEDLMREELPSLNFTPIKGSIQKVQELSAKIEEANLESVPIEYLNELAGKFDVYHDEFLKIKKLNLEGNPSEKRNRIIEKIDQEMNGLMRVVYSVLSADTVFNGKYDPIFFDKVKNEISEANTSANDKLSEINSILEKSRQASSQIGVAQYEKVFEEESTIHKKEAGKWFKYIVSVLVLILIAGIVLIFYHPEADGASDLIQISVAKIIVLTALLYGLAICIRNYKAHKHNEILNKHRQNALKTFEVFSKAAGDDLQTKNAVLLEATRTIFSNQQTGYLSPESEGDSSNKIIEIFKSVDKTK